MSLSAALRAHGAADSLRLRSANVLLISIKALANEVAKNLVLAGVKSLTLVDHEIVTEDDLGSQFFISEQDVGENVSCPIADASCHLTPHSAPKLPPQTSRSLTPVLPS